MSLYVNDTEITDEQVFAEMQYHPASSLSEAQEKAAQALAIRELLLQEAAQLGITAPDASAAQEVKEDYLISRVLDQEVTTPEPDDAACGRYYDNHPKVFLDTAGNPVPFEHVKATIAAYLKEVSWQMAVKQYIKVLAGKHRIAGIHLDAAESPLVQ